jgi:hypothetical protein
MNDALGKMWKEPSSPSFISLNPKISLITLRSLTPKRELGRIAEEQEQREKCGGRSERLFFFWGGERASYC